MRFPTLLARRAIPVVSLIAVLLSSSPTVSAELGEGPEHAALAIENGLLSIGVDREDGKLLNLVDLAAGHNHVDGGPDPAGLWRIDVRLDGQRAALTPEQATAFRGEILPPGQALRLTWSGFDLLGASECKVLEFSEN